MFERNMFGNSKFAVWSLIKRSLEIFKASISIGLLGSICEESHHFCQPNQDRSDFLVLLDFKQLNKNIIKWRWIRCFLSVKMIQCKTYQKISCVTNCIKISVDSILAYWTLGIPDSSQPCAKSRSAKSAIASKLRAVASTLVGDGWWNAD